MSNAIAPSIIVFMKKHIGKVGIDNFLYHAKV
jgi:hypothetical protein